MRLCSYLDVVNRLDPVVVALEKQDGPVMIISHQASSGMVEEMALSGGAESSGSREGLSRKADVLFREVCSETPYRRV